MSFQFGVEIDTPGFPILRIRIRPYREKFMVAIHVIPPELDGFLFAGTAQSQQPDVLGELRTVFRGGQSCRADLVNVLASAEPVRVLFGALPDYAVHWQDLDEAVHLCALEHVPQAYQREVARSAGSPLGLQLLQMCCEMVWFDLVEIQVAD